MTAGVTRPATVTTRPAGVAERLRAHAGAFGAKPAIVYPGGILTFAGLDAVSDGYAAGLHRAGIRKGTKTVLMLRPGPDLFAVLFGLLKVGAVPVVVDPGMGVRRMLHCYRAAGADAFVGIPAAHAIRKLNPRAFRGVRTVVTAGRRWCWGGHTLRSLLSGGGAVPAVELTGDDLLMVGFTTGSTGPAKGVESTHGALAAMVDQIAEVHDQGPADVALVTSPMFGVLHLLIGSTCVLAPIDPTRVAGADPAIVADLVDRYGVTCMFASPALLDPLARHLVESGRALPTLRCLVSGGAPVPDSVVTGLSGIATLHTTYGATEALPIASVVAADRPPAGTGDGTCVGRAVPGIRVRIVRATDDPLPAWSDDLLAPAGEIGEITVAGPTVSRRYHRLPAADGAHKVHDGQTVWHRTGDLGRLDDEGRLWFCGRKSQRVETAHGTLHTVPVEGVFNTHPDVYRTALVPGPVVCVQPRRGVPESRYPRIEAELRMLAARHEVTRQVAAYRFHPSFPVDVRHNAKIDREYLARWVGWRPGWRPARLIPVIGWLYLLAGLVFRFHQPGLVALLWLDAFLSIVVHGLQVPTGVKRGIRAGVSGRTSALMTFVFGATWYRALP
jgi:olefin beta-lactone synthetase